MHQKKIPRVKRSILHSIPLLLRSSGYATNSSNNRSIPITSTITNYLHNSNNKNNSNNNQLFRYLSSSIPLACMVALLLLSICIVSPNENSSNNAMLAFLPFGLSSSPAYAEEGDSSNSSRSATEPEPIATLDISGDLDQTNHIGPNDTVYRTHGIKVNLQDVTDYTLQVSYANGSNALVYDGTSSGNTTITGANNVQGSLLDTNTWGYAWSDNNTVDDSTLYYQTMPSFGSSNSGILKTESITGSDEVLTKTVNGKLVFAAKFASDAPYGHYKTSVLLSLAATPKKVTTTGFGGITNMQDMTASICNAASNGDTGTLLDTRDNTEYSVTKLEDGRCWMTTNLRITRESINAKDPSNTTGKITSADSNVSSNYTIPASSSPWDSSIGNTVARVHYAENTTNGANYTWCAATAGSCSSATTNNAVASSSICPKGWRLPAISEYTTLKDKGTSKVDSNTSDSVFDGWNIGGGFFPAAGYVSNGSLTHVGSVGYYWSSTAYSSTNAYILFFNSGDVNTGSNYRYLGYSVRCVAMNEEDEKTQPVYTWDDNLQYMQQMTPQACTAAPSKTPKTLTDSRDGSTYTVTKLDDTKCWMTTNLRIVNKEITPADSNVSSNYTIPASSSSGWSTSDGNAKNVLYNNDTTNGAYYTWCAATAGTCLQGTDEEVKDKDAPASVCPKEWRLPTKAEYDALIAKGISKVDNNTSDSVFDGWNIGSGFFPAAGRVYNGSLQGVGSDGYYWSSTAYSSTNAYVLDFGSGSVYTYASSRYRGFSVRCVAQE